MTCRAPPATQLSELDAIIAIVSNNPDFVDLSAEATCGFNDDTVVDYAVDAYCAAISAQLPEVFSNISCRGHDGAQHIKVLLDSYWAVAPPNLDL